MICPKCGETDAREWRVCPEENNEPVCADCCRQCRYHNYDETGGAVLVNVCGFYHADENLKRDMMYIAKLREMLG